MMSSSHRAWIALGSNLGDRRETLTSALIDLERTAGLAIAAVSSFWETPPIGGPPGQGAFLNAAAEVFTVLSPHDLRLALADAERRAGRVRKARWGERVLDLDLLFYGDGAIVRSDDLIVPHPRLSFRRFVLGPLSEIAPDLIDPVTGRSVAQLLENLDRRPRTLALIGVGGWPATDADRLIRLANAGIADVNDHWRIDDSHEPILIGIAIPEASPLWESAPRPRASAIAADPNAVRIGMLPDPFWSVPIVWAKSEPPGQAEAELVAACRAGDR